MKTSLLCLVVLGCVALARSTVIYGNGINPFEAYNGIASLPLVDSIRRRCPICDSSVYSYCSDKLFHDSCCCTQNPYDRLPYECQYADCKFLHANSCYEHSLITACCCSSFVK